jgi:acetate kinase
MTDASYLLVFNAGSSSLKVEVFARRPWRSCLRAGIAGIGRPRPVLRIDGVEPEELTDVATHADAAELAFERLQSTGREIAIDGRSVLATGHRVVHGGASFAVPVAVTPAVTDRLESLAHLAPLHNPASLAVMRTVQARLPHVPMIAVFDTAFFRDLPEHVRAYAIPQSWRQRYRIERYGFHGIAHEYLYQRCKALTHTKPGAERVITLQLGQGCSAAALRDGRAIETSMGFTPVEGLIMGTRPGDLDAGAVLYMARQGYSWQALEDALNRESGLLGLSGESDDVRDLLKLEAAERRGATLALAAFCHRVHKYLGAYAAVLGGVDALVFGGGIGENAPVIRSRVCAGLAWLGLEVDEDANARCIGTEQRISKTSSSIEVYVVPVREEEAIARSVVTCLEAEAGPASAA